MQLTIISVYDKKDNCNKLYMKHLSVLRDVIHSQNIVRPDLQKQVWTLYLDMWSFLYVRQYV